MENKVSIEQRLTNIERELDIVYEKCTSCVKKDSKDKDLVKVFNDVLIELSKVIKKGKL